MSVLGISAGNKEQSELLRLIMDKQHSIIVCTGPAGTGKNFISIATAIELKQNHKYGDIFYTRNPVQLGENIGFTTGDADEKMALYMKGLYDNIAHIAHKSGYNEANLKMQVKTIDIIGLRGASFENCIVIIDECQNFNLDTLKTIITRMGENTKLVLMGDYNQIDDKVQARYDRCDFEEVADWLCDNLSDYAARVELTQSMRSPICAKIDNGLTELGKQLRKNRRYNG